MRAGRPSSAAALGEESAALRAIERRAAAAQSTKRRLEATRTNSETTSEKAIVSLSRATASTLTSPSETLSRHVAAAIRSNSALAVLLVASPDGRGELLDAAGAGTPSVEGCGTDETEEALVRAPP